MPSVTLTVTQDTSTDVNFRAWGSAISAALTAAGFPLTADTGQVNWTTVAHPTTVNDLTAYEIRTFSDAAQATAPIYFKIAYGSYSNSVTAPQISITAGTGSDGAGNITGTYFPLVTAANQVTSSQMLFVGGVSSGGTKVYLTSDASGFVLLAWPTVSVPTITGGFLCLERTRAFDGTATTDGFHVLHSNTDGSNSSSNTQTMISFLPNSATKLDTVATNLVQPGSNQLPNMISYVVGGVMHTVPVLTGVNARLGGPSQFVLAAPIYDMVSGNTIPITHYGVSYTWRALGAGRTSGSTYWGPGPQGFSSYLVRVS